MRLQSHIFRIATLFCCVAVLAEVCGPGTDPYDPETKPFTVVLRNLPPSVALSYFKTNPFGQIEANQGPETFPEFHSDLKVDSNGEFRFKTTLRFDEYIAFIIDRDNNGILSTDDGFVDFIKERTGQETVVVESVKDVVPVHLPLTTDSNLANYTISCELGRFVYYRNQIASVNAYLTEVIIAYDGTGIPTESKSGLLPEGEDFYGICRKYPSGSEQPDGGQLLYNVDIAAGGQTLTLGAWFTGVE